MRAIEKNHEASIFWEKLESDCGFYFKTPDFDWGFTAVRAICLVSQLTLFQKVHEGSLREKFELYPVGEMSKKSMALLYTDRFRRYFARCVFPPLLEFAYKVQAKALLNEKNIIV